MLVADVPLHDVAWYLLRWQICQNYDSCACQICLSNGLGVSSSVTTARIALGHMTREHGAHGGSGGGVGGSCSCVALNLLCLVTAWVLPHGMPRLGNSCHILLCCLCSTASHKGLIGSLQGSDTFRLLYVGLRSAGADPDP